ncbi:energy transducer TonB [uncultured Algibacter sp.]|uniref:energy transducer TonB n=1 Tax=uncultured Algibacter sp. TaxID=298659 RepID=UPI00342E8B6A
MENNIQNIELINAYLNKRLSEKEIQYFENRLKADFDFNILFNEHVTFLEGIKRQQLKVDIGKAKQSYIKSKWLKYLGFTSGLIILIISVISNINSGESIIEIPNPIKSEVNNSVSILDSVVPNDSIEEIVFKETIKTKQTKTKEVIVKKEITEVEIPKKSFQTFTINQKKDTTIICKEGTKLTIKANSFITDNSKIAIGNVDLKVTEYYQLSDILLTNLSTQSDGKLLETGGMLNLEAFSDDRPLKLKQNSSIDILFPTNKKNMKLFTGELNKGNINWSLADVNEEVEPTIEEIEVIEEDIDVPFAVVEEVPIYPGCENGSRTQRKNCTSEAISKFVLRNFNTQMADDIGLVGRQRINVIFKIDKNGNIVDIQSRAPEPELEMEAIRVITSLPKMKPGKQRGKAVSVPYSLPIIFEANGVASVGRSTINRRIRDSVYRKSFETRLTGNDNAKVSISEVSSYILRSSKLGWINCDRFVNSRNRIKYKLKIEDVKGIIRVKMVFKSMSSVLSSRRSGKEFDFRMVPKNEDIMLIAIKQNEGKLYLDVIDTKTVENPNIEFNFKEINLENLKSELKKLNKLF